MNKRSENKNKMTDIIHLKNRRRSSGVEMYFYYIKMENGYQKDIKVRYIIDKKRRDRNDEVADRGR